MTVTIPIPLETIQQFFSVNSQGTITAGFDIKTLVGMSGIPFVEAAVQYLRDQWELPAKLSPLMAMVVSVLLNILLALALKNDVLSAVYIGFFTGLFSSVWHEKIKPAS